MLRFVCFEAAGAIRVGVHDHDGDTFGAFALPGSVAAGGVLGLIRAGHTPDSLPPIECGFGRGEIRLLAPLPRPPRNVFCVGKNYAAHVREFSASGYDNTVTADLPQEPIVFSKLPDSVIGPGADIRLDPAVTSALDYEGELGVVIGRGGRAIAAAEALDHVWGYTIINDVTARDLQKTHKQWLLGKSQDTFCPLGPCVIPRAALDLGNTRVRTWVNGELRQDASTAQMIFDVPTLIATISRGITLQPGDVIASGTPEGVGVGFTPPKFLTDGDEVTVEIEPIGRLVNRVAAV